MTPQQIAREAAEALYKELSEADPIKENERIARLILTAAARMVRESGAEQALVETTEQLDRLGQAGIVERAVAALAKLRAIGEDQQP